MKLVKNNNKDYKNIIKVLNELFIRNYPGCTILEFKNSIKIILKEIEYFTVTYISFEKSKIIFRHNIKSYDNLIPVLPNHEFISKILTEIRKLGFELSKEENDDLQSTCRIELERRN